MVYLHVVLGEMVPKNIALAGPDRAALVLGPPIWGVVTVLRPVIVVLNAIADRDPAAVRGAPRDEVSSTYTREEVAALVEESRGEGLLEAEEYDRLAGALGFTEKPVATVLLPPESLTTVRRGSTAGRGRGALRRHRLQPVPGRGRRRRAARLPAHQGRARDRRRPPPAGRSRTSGSARSRRCAADDLLHDALETLQRRGAHMARVVDGDGATLGVATLEDVLEELVGEIRDAAHHDDLPASDAVVGRCGA